jgi:hypothetical protein
MASFDFITDEDFRISLENDFKEMNLCIQSGAYKAAVVVAGSIVEALLIDYVIAENIVTREDALKLDFGKVLTLCKDKKIISEKTSDLSSAVKGYRNLIHPGRAIRLNESVNKDSADVAKALVGIVIGDVEKQKKENYGYTAEQIVAKIKNDSNASAILSILIKRTNPTELERLMLKYLPDAYLEEITMEERWEEYERGYVKQNLVLCFRTSFDNADDKLKTKLANWFAKIIREESDSVISSYGIAFLRSSDMKYMHKDDVEIVKQHFFGQMKNNMNETILEALSGMGTYLKQEDIASFIDPLARAICHTYTSEKFEDNIVSFLAAECIQNTNKEVDELIHKRLDGWKNTFKRKEQAIYVEKIERLISAVEIPF